jgi:N-succinyldiaminopimelate aminotransferase
LSKRSNLPGLRSGFVAGDAKILQQFLRYRTYHGCAMPVQHQMVSAKIWQDETHVRENRTLYREKFNRVYDIINPVMPLTLPAAGFYLWAKTPIPDDHFACQLHAAQAVAVLPGRYLGRTEQGINPGEGFVRMALVATVAECIEAAQRIHDFATQQSF